MFSILNLLVSHVRRSQAIRLTVFGVLFLLAGALAFSITEHRSYLTALYWAITTATTVGYGDVTPKTGAGRTVAVLTMLTTIPLFAAAFASFAATVAATRLGRLLHVGRELPAEGHVTIYGMHPAVPRVVRELHEAGQTVVLTADTDGSGLPEAVHVVRGDPTDEHVIRRSHPERARQVLITGRSDGEVLVTAVILRRLAPKVPTVAVTRDVHVAEALHDLGVTQTVSAEVLLGHALAKSLEAPHAASMLLRLVDGHGYRLQEVPVGAGDVGEPLSAVRRDFAGIVLGLVHEDDVSLGVDHDPQVAEGDKLLVVTPDERHERQATY